MAAVLRRPPTDSDDQFEQTPGWTAVLLGAATLLLIALVAVACGTAPASAPASPIGILLIDVGEPVQVGPPTESQKVLFSDLINLAEANGADLGYPWFDATTGEIVASVVTPRGATLIDAAKIPDPHRIRTVSHGTTELRRIQDDASSLAGRGVPNANLIVVTAPDWRDNRTLIVLTAPSQPLIDTLVGLYPADAVAIQVDPTLAP
jgi:hypothetical protein